MKFKNIVIITFFFVLFGSPAVLFAGGHEHSDHHPAPAAAQVHQGHGTIISVDMATATVRMEHEPIESLRWPKMVMNLQAVNAELLEGLTEGDRIVFDLERTDKGFMITRIERTR